MAVVRIARVPLAAPVVVVWIEFFRTTPPLIHIVWAYYVLPVLFGLRLSALAVVILALAANTSAPRSFALAFRQCPGASARRAWCSA
jgi:polar amino acid transport system permease protein